MPRNSSARGAIFTAGLGFGVAAGVALGTLVIAPNLPGHDIDTGSAPALGVENPNQQDSSDNAPDPEPATNVAGTLTNRPVLVFRTENAPQSSFDELERQLENAGAINAGTITLNDRFFASDVDGVTRVAQLLAQALLLNPQTGEPKAPTEDRARALQTLRDTGFIDYEDATILPTQGVVLLTGDPAEEQAVANQAEFLDAMARGGGAPVAAGPVSGAGGKGLLGKLRSEGGDISTVDSVEAPGAATSVVLAVAERIAGRSGHYGVAGDADARTPAPGQDNE